MRCYACDMSVEGEPDKDTGRWYCVECFQPTIEEQLRLSGSDQPQEESGIISLTQEPAQDCSDIPGQKQEEEDNEYF